MRSTLLAFLGSVAIVSATGCAQDNIKELAARSNCGRSKSIARCLHTGVNLARLGEIEMCFVAGGCELAEAKAEAVWFALDCRAVEVQEVGNELKRRAGSSTSATESSVATAKSTTAKTSTAKSSTASVASTSATTTSASAATTSGSSASSASTASSTSSTSTTTTSTSTGTAAAATTTGTLACSVTSTVSTTACSVSGGKTITCSSTTTAISSCAAGLICFTETAGANVCMKRDDSLTTSGLVVTIVFAVGIGAAIVAFTILGLRSRAKAKKDAAARLLAAAHSGSDGKDEEAAHAFVSSKGGASEANLPLIPPARHRN